MGRRNARCVRARFGRSLPIGAVCEWVWVREGVKEDEESV